MFRRWRRARLAAQAAAHTAASAPRPTAADLRGEHIFELVNAKLSQFIGPAGQWSLVRRRPDDTDAIFHAMLTHQIAAEVTRTLLEERETVAVIVPADEQTLALSWTPAPLVVWADPVELDVDASDTSDAQIESDAAAAAGIPSIHAVEAPARAA
jgi:hypothetical protein